MLPCFLFKISAAGKTPVIPQKHVVKNPIPCYDSEQQIKIYFGAEIMCDRNKLAVIARKEAEKFQFVGQSQSKKRPLSSEIISDKRGLFSLINYCIILTDLQAGD